MSTLCDVDANHFIYCMKEKAKTDKCKIEFELWELCYKNAYLKEFIGKKESKKKMNDLYVKNL